MAGEFIAVEQCEVRPSGIVVPGSGTVTIVSPPSTVLFSAQRGAYTTPLRFTVTGASAAGFVAGSVRTTVTAEIVATATKVRSEGEFVMREGDANLAVAMEGILTGTTTLSPFTEPWSITAAGQVKARAA